jgi:hypothetical protein
MILRSIVAIWLRWLCIVVLFTCIVMPSTLAWGADKCGSLDRVITAIRLTQVLYPELSEKEFSLQFSEGTGGPTSSPADVRSFLIAVDKPLWHPPGNAEANVGVGHDIAAAKDGDLQLPLYLQFSFVEPSASGSKYFVSCRPLQFLNESGRERMKAALAAIDAHPEWNDIQDIEEAKKRGMQFGPEKKAAILRRIPLQKLIEFYGQLRIKKVEFSVASNRMKEPNSSFADLRWYVDAEEVGTPRALQITVESFGGKIDGISEYREQR